MLFKTLAIGLLIASSAISKGNPAQKAVIDQMLAGLEVVASSEPYSRNIQRMYLGLDKNGQPRVGIAFRKIEAFETLTGIVVVEKTPQGYMLREVLFPDIGKIQNAKDHGQVLSILEKFKNVPFNPHAEKSAVDGLTGATQHLSQVGGYLNYMARRIALEMEERPDWTKPRRK